MKKFKIIDFWVSVSLIVASIITGLIGSFEYFFIGYFIVGAWQIVSMIVHHLKKWFCEWGSRRNSYHLIILVFAIYACFGFLSINIIFPLLILLLFTAPIQAVFYCMLCWNEITVKMKRPMAVLK